MTSLENRLAKLEAPLMPKGPVIVVVDDVSPDDRERQVKAARELGVPVVFMTKLDLAL